MAQRPTQLPRIQRSARRGVTLTEVLVAVTISLVFMTSVLAAYIQISRAASQSEARIQAHTKARNAVDMLLRDLRFVRTDPTLAPEDQVFELVDGPMAQGDRIDNDRDGSVDEEVVDGYDEDGDWQVADDLHAALTGSGDRRAFIGLADLGDLKVDEDTVFSRDRLTFRLPADPGMGRPAVEYSWYVDSWNGRNDVLVRQVRTFVDIVPTVAVEPVAFDVLSFDVLAWNANNDVPSPGGKLSPYWVSDFDAGAVAVSGASPYGAPGLISPFLLPAAVRVQITASAEPVGLEDSGKWPLGSEPLETATMAGVVGIESITGTLRYELFVRPTN